MRDRLGAAIDRRFAELIVAWARRRWPVLRLVPAVWMRPLTTPTAVQLRRSFWRVAGGVIIATSLSLVLLVLLD